MRLLLVPVLVVVVVVVALSVPVLPVVALALALALVVVAAVAAAALRAVVVLARPGDLVAVVLAPLEAVPLVRVAAVAGPRHFPPDQRRARDLVRPLRGHGRCD